MRRPPREVPPSPSTELPEEEARALLRKRTRRSFLVGGGAVVAAAAAWRWLASAPGAGGIPSPLRGALRLNERVSRAAFDRGRLAPTFPLERAGPLRPNGREGLADDDLDPATWRLEVTGLAGGARQLTLADVRALPRREMVTEFKCIEGWSAVVRWAGARFSDFAERYPPATPSGRPYDPARDPHDVPPFVAMATPDEEYFVGLDTDSALHPQTLLAWELNGEPLTPEHGAPLRLVIPVKYGIKNIKRIGRIAWSDRQPPDYWAARGYDWYAGL